MFAEVELKQKKRIIIALKKAGNVVGYLDDGINDASALHAVDVGISVESAVDVAKEAADIVLMQKDLNVCNHREVEFLGVLLACLRVRFVTSVSIECQPDPLLVSFVVHK